VEIIFLLVGLTMLGFGAAIIVSEIRSRYGAESVTGRVIGFSGGRSNKPNSLSFHSVAQFIAPNGRTYYVEGAIGSSAPLHAIGDSVTVLVNPLQPEAATLKSRLSFVLGFGIAFMGLVSVSVFWLTFHATTYSFIAVAVMLAGIAFKVKGAWRRERLSMAGWKEYKKQIVSPRVFTEESKDRIAWADPINVTVAVERYKKSQRFAVPILLILGLGAVFLAHHFYQKTAAFLEKAQPTAGVVVDLKENEPSDSSDSSTYAAVVEYADHQGRKHQFKDSFSSNPPTYHRGQTVSILFNPDNPGEAQMDRGRLNYLVTYIFGCMAALLLLAANYANRAH
jgi:hypothetical protein